MNLLDIIIIICFIPALINGIRKGLVAQAVSIFSIILGAWLSFRFSSEVSSWIGQFIPSATPAILNITAFTLILIAVIFILFAIGKIIEASIKIVMLGWLNKILGVIFALVKCALFIGLAIILFDSLNKTFNIAHESYFSESVLYPHFRHMAYTVFPYLKQLLFN